MLPLVVGQATRLAQHLTAIGQGIHRDGAVRRDDRHLRRVGRGRAANAAARREREASKRALGRFRGHVRSGAAALLREDGRRRALVRARPGRASRLQPAPATVTAHDAVELVALRRRCARGCACAARPASTSARWRTISARRSGCGAILDGLVRTEAAGFRLDDALPFEALVTAPRDEVRAAVRPMETLLTDLPAVDADRARCRLGPARPRPAAARPGRGRSRQARAARAAAAPDGRLRRPRRAGKDARVFAPCRDFQLQLTILGGPKGRDIRRSGPRSGFGR